MQDFRDQIIGAAWSVYDPSNIGQFLVRVESICQEIKNLGFPAVADEVYIACYDWAMDLDDHVAGDAREPLDRELMAIFAAVIKQALR